MKKLPHTLAVASAMIAATAAFAQSVPVGQTGLIAGFDFANYNSTQINSTTIEGQNGVQAPFYSSFYSDVSPAGDRGAHTNVNDYVASGRILFTGSPVSDNWTGTSFAPSLNNALVTANNVAANSTINTFRRNNSGDTLFGRDLIGDGSEINSGFTGSNIVAGLELKPGQLGSLPDSIAFAFNSTGFRDLTFSMGAQLVGASPNVTISWSYSFNGVDVLSTGLTSLLNTTTATAYSVNLSPFDVVENDSEFFLIANLTTASGSHLRMDNVQLTGTAIPEPSSFAALAGLAGLGCAALRRRRRVA